MRNAIVIGLAIIAVLAAGVWGLGQFGGALTGGVGEAQAPIVREPEIVVASAPVQAPAANPQASLRTAPAATPAPAAPAVPEATQPAVPETPPAVVEAVPPVEPGQAAPNTKPSLTTTLDGKNGLQLPKLPGQSQQQSAPAQPETQTQSVEAAPQARMAPPADTQTSTPAAEPRVFAQQAPAVVAAVPAGLESQFKSRKVTYNRPPQKLALDKAVDVSLVINATEDENAGQEALKGFPGTVVERDVELSDTVSAQLTGVGFDITSQTVERQRLSGKVINRWAWRVTPTEIGEHTMILEIFGYASGSLDAEPLDAYRDVIVVEVQQFDQIVSWAKGVQPLFAVLAALAGIGSAIFAFLRFREEKKQTKKLGE